MWTQACDNKLEERAEGKESRIRLAMVVIQKKKTLTQHPAQKMVGKDQQKSMKKVKIINNDNQAQKNQTAKKKGEER